MCVYDGARWCGRGWSRACDDEEKADNRAPLSHVRVNSISFRVALTADTVDGDVSGELLKMDNRLALSRCLDVI